MQVQWRAQSTLWAAPKLGDVGSSGGEAGPAGLSAHKAPSSCGIPPLFTKRTRQHTVVSVCLCYPPLQFPGFVQ